MNLNECDVAIVAQNRDLPTHQRFLYEAKKMGLRAQVLALDNYSFMLTSAKIKPKKERRWVIHRTMGVNFDEFDLRVTTHLARLNFQVSNPLPLLSQMRDKVSQLQFLGAWGAPIIPTFLMRGNIDGENLSALKKFIHLTKSSRFILKTERGNHGLGVSLVNGLDSLYSWLSTLHATKDQRYILQPFIENAREFRVLMSQDNILGMVEKKRQRQHFKHNAGHTQFVPVKQLNHLQQNMITLSQDLQNKMQTHFLAIDFLLADKTIHLLEIGLCPGFIEFERACRVNIAKKVLVDLFK